MGVWVLHCPQIFILDFLGILFGIILLSHGGDILTKSSVDLSLKFSVPKITKQTKSHSLNFNVLSSVIDSSGEEVWVSFDSDNYFYVKTWFE